MASAITCVFLDVVQVHELTDKVFNNSEHPTPDRVTITIRIVVAPFSPVKIGGT